MKELWIVGYRDFGFEVAEAAEAAGFSVPGFIDYDPSEKRQDSRTFTSRSIDSMTPAFQERFVCAMTSTLLRQSLVERISSLTQGNSQPEIVIHPRATVSPSANIADGSIVMANSVLAAGSELGKFCMVNRGATIGHHTTLGDFCTAGPGVNIGGTCSLGRNTYVGIGATVLNKIRVGSHCLIGAGAVVTKNVPDHTLVMGVPAHVVKTDYPGR